MTVVNEGFGMKKIWKRLICLALLLALCLGLGLAFSEETGKVTLTIGSADSKFDRKGIKVELYRISTNVIKEDWSLLPAFSRRPPGRRTRTARSCLKAWVPAFITAGSRSVRST